MTEITKMGSGSRNDMPTYGEDKDKFEQTTDKPDGSMLVTFDTTAHKIVGTYMAWGGFWNSTK